MNKLLFFLFISIGFFLSAQDGFTTNNNELEEIYQRSSIKYTQEGLFSDIRPYRLSDVNRIQKDSIDMTYCENELSDLTEIERKSNKKIWGLFYGHSESFLEAKTKDFQIRVNPILELKIGKEKDNDNLLYTAFRGIETRGSIAQSLNFYFQFTENQYRPFQYINQYGSGFNGQNNYNFNPYYTYWKDINHKQGYDFSNSIGYIQYQPNKHFSLLMGHDRNHYGYGYRSLFLSDNGAPYFQLKADAYFWKVHYQALFAQFTGQYIRGGDRLLPKKYGAFHLLTFQPSKKLELGLFEGVLFHRNDGFELNYLNPIIFYHTIEHSLGSSDNVLMGFQAKYNFNSQSQIYCQFLLDDIQVNQFLKSSGWWGNKYGVQAGLNLVDILNIPHLDGQLEWNMVKPYTYSHYTNDNTDSIDNYTHYNQPLAHPFGANFMEIFGKLAYRPSEKTKITIKYDYNIRGLDIGGVLYGNNIFANTTGNTIASEFENSLFQGNKMTSHFIMLSGQYSLSHNIFWDLDFIYRRFESDLTNSSQTTLGFSTGLRINLRKRDYFF